MPRKRGLSEAEVDDYADSQPSQQSSQLPPISPDELEKLIDLACRHALLREHSRKPLNRADLKDAVLGKDRPDRGGKILRAVIAGTNERLLELAGLELVWANSAGEADDSAAGPSQTGASQMDATQDAGKAVKTSAAAGKLIMINRLQNALVPAVAIGTSVYHAFVEVILTLVVDNGGRMSEIDLHEMWLPKLGLKEMETLPGCGSVKVGDLVSKRMVSEGFLSKTHGNLAIGPRYYLSRNTEAATNFRRDQLEA